MQENTPETNDAPSSQLARPTTYLEAIQLINKGQEVEVPVSAIGDLIVGATLDPVKWRLHRVNEFVRIKLA